MKLLSEKTLSDADVLRHLSEILRQSRRVEADLVFLIGEVDSRKLYAREAVSSIFAYCTEILHLSEPETVLRIRVARASREHPALLTMLREGRIHLSGIALLAPLITPQNRAVLLKRATHKSKEEIRKLVADLAPRPEAPSTIRKLPARPAPPPLPPERLLCPDTVETPNPLIHREIDQPPRALNRLAGSGSTAPHPGSLPARSPRLATVEPLGDDRYRVQYTASTEARDRLRRLQALMRSSVPDGDLARIIDEAVKEKLQRLEARRFGKTKTPRKTLAETDTTPSSRHVPAAVRRAVHARDEGRCTYVDRHGRRCRTREKLEFHHHDVPFGHGGPHSPANVRLMCRTHNALLAEADYGKEKMAGHRRAGRRQTGKTAADERAGRSLPGESPPAP